MKCFIALSIMLAATSAFAGPQGQQQERDHVKQVYRDRSGHMQGYTEERSGKVEARSPSGHLLGYYDERTRQTRDSSGRLIGNGDRTSHLIMEASSY